MKLILSIAMGAVMLPSSPARAEEPGAFRWEKVVLTDEGETYWLDRKNITDSNYDGIPVKKADIKVTNFKGFPDVDELFGVLYLRCDPAGWRPILAGGKRKSDGKLVTMPSPPLKGLATAPEGSPERLIIEKACAL